MPIAAKFSKEFYAKLGHGIADELVDWFNKVDTTYRSEFRELFEVNFARFDAKLEQRLAEVKAELMIGAAATPVTLQFSSHFPKAGKSCQLASACCMWSATPAPVS